MEIGTLVYKTTTSVHSGNIFLALQLSLDNYDMVFDPDKEEEIQRRVLGMVSEILVPGLETPRWKMMVEESCICSATKFYDFVLSIALTDSGKKIEFDCFLSQV